jgi:hypothetical protein
MFEHRQFQIARTSRMRHGHYKSRQPKEGNVELMRTGLT